MRTPGAEELAVWNDAEAPEPPANLTATLKGAVIHRFCETFCEGDNAEVRLRESFEHVRSMRRAQLAGRELGIDDATAVADLLPLAQNYLASEVFRRVQDAARINVEENSQSAIRNPQSSPGLWSELRFRLRRPLGILTGTIDKLLITPAANGLDVEIIDFKTNRFCPRDFPTSAPTAVTRRRRQALVTASRATVRDAQPGQAAFDFETVAKQSP